MITCEERQKVKQELLDRLESMSDDNSFANYIKKHPYLIEQMLEAGDYRYITEQPLEIIDDKYFESINIIAGSRITVFSTKDNKYKMIFIGCDKESYISNEPSSVSIISY